MAAAAAAAKCFSATLDEVYLKSTRSSMPSSYLCIRRRGRIETRCVGDDGIGEDTIVSSSRASSITALELFKVSAADSAC